MEGGTISGNIAEVGGGGIAVIYGTFTMQNGVITGNTASIYGGGGVAVFKNGTFTMSDGEVSGNTAKNGGGGIRVLDGGTFIMQKGKITGNQTPAFGGGVIVSGTGSTFIMEDGKISGNVTRREGGGVWAGKAVFIMRGGEISGNESVGSGSGVLLLDGTFIMSGGARVSADNAVSLYCFSTSGNSSVTVGGDFIGPAGPVAKIDLITVSDLAANLSGRTILKLADGYKGNLSMLKDRFTLGNVIVREKGTSESPYTYLPEPITAYEIGADGTLQASGR
jgi:hypothetical protein